MDEGRRCCGIVYACCAALLAMMFQPTRASIPPVDVTYLQSTNAPVNYNPLVRPRTHTHTLTLSHPLHRTQLASCSTQPSYTHTSVPLLTPTLNTPRSTPTASGEPLDNTLPPAHNNPGLSAPRTWHMHSSRQAFAPAIVWQSWPQIRERTLNVSLQHPTQPSFLQAP